jgi:hypothetical protein
MNERINKEIQDGAGPSSRRRKTESEEGRRRYHVVAARFARRVNEREVVGTWLHAASPRM